MTPCRCDHYAFPHRRTWQCDEWAREAQREADDIAADERYTSMLLDRDEIAELKRLGLYGSGN